MPSKGANHLISALLFRLGQLILLSGYTCFMIGMATSYWVVRPIVDYDKEKIDPTKVDVVEHFGIFLACKQLIEEASSSSAGGGSSDEEELEKDCGSMPGLINFVDTGAIHLVQAMMVIACILYFSSLILEIVQILPLSTFRNFLAENRLVEMMSGIATVLALVAMVIYAGEIKNKAELVPGQEDEKVGWSFIVAIIGLSFGIIGLLMVTMFRHLPVITSETSNDKGGSWLR